jgi:hypothetical protein
MRGRAGDYISGGTTYSYTPANAVIVADGNASHVRVRVTGVPWDPDFEAGAGEQLLPGTTFTGATRYPFNSDAEPGLDISGNGRGCNQLFGEFTVHEAAYDEGGDLEKFSVTFEQHCESPTAPALFGSIAWHADNPANPIPLGSKLALSSDKASYVTGQTAKVTATLTSASANRTVSIFATPYGGSKTLLKTATVDAQGKLTATLTLSRRTTFSATYAGDEMTDPSSATRTVTVAARVASTMYRYRARSNGYYLYNVTGSAWMKATVSPNHAGDCLYFRAQARVGGVWRTFGTTDCVRMTSLSVARVYLEGDRELLGYALRMRAEWRGNTKNTAANSAWRYFKFTR